jgi:hypothetical protein
MSVRNHENDGLRSSYYKAEEKLNLQDGFSFLLIVLFLLAYFTYIEKIKLGL